MGQPERSGLLFFGAIEVVQEEGPTGHLSELFPIEERIQQCVRRKEKGYEGAGCPIG